MASGPRIGSPAPDFTLPGGVLSGDAFERYTGMILELASELEAPVFEPHVTLLSLTGPWTDHARRTRQHAHIHSRNKMVGPGHFPGVILCFQRYNFLGQLPPD